MKWLIFELFEITFMRCIGVDYRENKNSLFQATVVSIDFNKLAFVDGLK